MRVLKFAKTCLIYIIIKSSFLIKQVILSFFLLFLTYWGFLLTGILHTKHLENVPSLYKKMHHYMFFKKMLPDRTCRHVVYELFLKLKQNPVLRCQRKMKDLLKSHWSKKRLLSLKEVHLYHALYRTLIIILIRMTGGDRIINRVSG